MTPREVIEGEIVNDGEDDRFESPAALIRPSINALGPATGSATTPAAAYLARLSESSRKKQFYAVREIVSILTGGASVDVHNFAWHTVEHFHAQALRQVLGKRFAIATANRLLSAFRGVIKETWRLGLIDEERRARVADVANIKGSAPPAGRLVERDEFAKLIVACLQDDNVLRGTRDAAMLAILDGGGLRRAEAVSLRISDYSPKDRAFKVIGKGNKYRRAFVPPSAAKRLEEWLRVRAEWLREHRPEAATDDAFIFTKVVNRRVTQSPLHDDRVRAILAQRIHEAGLDRLTPHDFRRTVISRLLDKDVDIAQVQRMVGHASVTTTARYDRRGERKHQEAAERLDGDDA